ncbi:MAG: hypothetical protein ABIA63_12090 [bacterium]
MKIIGWSVPEEIKEIDSIIQKIKDMGFDSYEVTGKKNENVLLDMCGKYGINTYKVIEPLKKRNNALLQTQEPIEETYPGYIEINNEYQYGGEPVSGNREILNKELACPLDPGVIDYAINQVERARQIGHHGICWDFIGYRNYHSCECSLCCEKLKAYIQNNPDKEERTSAKIFYETNLVNLYSNLYDNVKRIAPEMKIICHCHPVYLPDPFICLKYKVDYCGITVSWFFKPHWAIEKVKDYISMTVNGPYAYSQTKGMPMIGFYGYGDQKKHYRSQKRIRLEFDILREEGAKALMMCETEHIIKCREIAEVIKNNLV